MKNLSEVFEEVRSAETMAEKVDILRKYNTNVATPVAIILQGAFHPNINFVFSPDELPEYKPDVVPSGMGYTDVQKELSRLYLFVKGSRKADPNLTNERRKQILIQILEAMEKPEAELFLAMLRKDLTPYGITYRMVLDAFPSLLPPIPTTPVNDTITIRT